MNQSRKFRRQFRAATRKDPLPPGWDQVEQRERGRVNEAMKTLQQMLPDRGLVLLAAPSGTAATDVDAIACVHNLTNRSQVASLFESMLEWWSGQVIAAQPDRACVAALREGVAAVKSVPRAEVARQLGATTMRVLEAIAQRQRPETEDCLMLATVGLTLYSDRHEPEQHQPPGGFADASGAPPPAPMPPPRSWPKGNTKETLVADLLEHPPSVNRDQLIEMAREGKFHDWESEVAGPKMLLVDMLARFGFPELAGKARDGGYDDEPPTVEQLEVLRRDIGAERFDETMGDGDKRGQA
jgi:hypothetical protein